MAGKTNPLVVRMDVGEFLREMMAKCQSASELDDFLKRNRRDFSFQLDTGKGIVDAEEWLIDMRVFFGK